MSIALIEAFVSHVSAVNVHFPVIQDLEPRVSFYFVIANNTHIHVFVLYLRQMFVCVL